MHTWSNEKHNFLTQKNNFLKVNSIIPSKCKCLWQSNCSAMKHSPLSGPCYGCPYQHNHVGTTTLVSHDKPGWSGKSISVFLSIWFHPFHVIFAFLHFQSYAGLHLHGATITLLFRNKPKLNGTVKKSYAVHLKITWEAFQETKECKEHKSTGPTHGQLF